MLAIDQPKPRVVVVVARPIVTWARFRTSICSCFEGGGLHELCLGDNNPRDCCSSACNSAQLHTTTKTTTATSRNRFMQARSELGFLARSPSSKQRVQETDASELIIFACIGKEVGSLLGAEHTQVHLERQWRFEERARALSGFWPRVVDLHKKRRVAGRCCKLRRARESTSDEL